MKNVFFILLILLMPLLALSQTDSWIQVSESGNGKSFINKAKITWDNGIAKAWIKYYPSSEDKKGTISIFVERQSADKIRKWMDYEYTLTLEEFYCAGSKSRRLLVYHYDKNGNCLDSYTDDAPEWRLAVPESVGESILKSICLTKK